MGFIKNRKIKHARKKAMYEARKREVRYWKMKGLSRAAIAARIDVPESSILKIYDEV